MSSIGTGYDLSATTYSPDGRVFQVEYALKAVENSGTAIALKCKDGVVMALEKLVHAKLLVPGSNSRIGSVDRHVGLAMVGLLADGRALLNRAKTEAANYRQFYKTGISGTILAQRLALYMQAYTLYSHVRPFGASVVIAVYDKSGPQIHVIEPSGVCYGYHGCALGKARQTAKTEIEKLKLKEMSCKEVVNHAARIIHSVHDEVKDKEFELEISWICEDSKYQHERVPEELVKEAERLAKVSLTEEMVD